MSQGIVRATNLLPYLLSIESSVASEFLYIARLMKGGHSRNVKATVVVKAECEKFIIEENLQFNCCGQTREDSAQLFSHYFGTVHDVAYTVDSELRSIFGVIFGKDCSCQRGLFQMI
jgi:hypothetical protein